MMRAGARSTRRTDAMNRVPTFADLTACMRLQGRRRLRMKIANLLSFAKELEFFVCLQIQIEFEAHIINQNKLS
jgi:hypothetical protein